MADAVDSITINGATTKGVRLTSSGTRYSLLDVGTSWTSLRVSWRMLMAGPEATIDTGPLFFIGLCADGKPYGHGSATCVGVRTIEPAANSYVWSASENGWVCEFETVQYDAGVETITGTHGTPNLVREGSVVTSGCYAVEIIRGTPWTTGGFQIIISTDNDTTTLTDDQWRLCLLGRTTTHMVTAYNSMITGGSGIASSNLGTPDEGTNGDLKYLNLYWNLSGSTATSFFVHTINATIVA